MRNSGRQVLRALGVYAGKRLREALEERTRMKPMVLLDLDGVINAHKDDPSMGFELLWRGGKYGWVIEVAHDTVEALRLLLSGSNEVLWCTAWREDANRDPMQWMIGQGLQPPGTQWHVVTNGGALDKDGFTTGWKLDAVRKDIRVRFARDAGRPIYWIEDFGFGELDRFGYPVTDISELGVLELGITPIDTYQDGRLKPEHILQFEELVR